MTDPIGWFLATTHQMLGHDTTAGLIGAAPGDPRDCVLCRYERGEATRDEAEAALAPQGRVDG